MRADLASRGKKLAFAGIKIQFFVGVVIVANTAMFYPHYWVAACLGVITFLLPHSIFSYWVFRYAGATKNRIVAQSFNQGMKIKLVVSILLFVIAFSQFNAHPFPLFGAYVITMASQWAAMLYLSRMS